MMFYKHLSTRTRFYSQLNMLLLGLILVLGAHQISAGISAKGIPEARHKRKLPEPGQVVKREDVTTAEPSNETTTLAPTPSNFRCPQKWSYYHDGGKEYCMKVFAANQAILRQQADSECKKHGSNLVSLHSTKEENFMRALMAFESATVSDLNFWIGLRCQHNITYWPESKQQLPIDLQIRITSCIFSWSDSTGSGNYRNWVVNTLSDNAAQADKRECAAYSELDDGWVRAHCDSERHRGYICKMKLGEGGSGGGGGEEGKTTNGGGGGGGTTASPTSSTSSNHNNGHGTKILLIGGPSTSSKTMETVVPGNIKSSTKSSVERKMGGWCLVAGLIGGKIIAAGGYNSTNKHNGAEEFIESQNRWKVIDGLEMLWFTACPAYITYNDMLYVFGGLSTDLKTSLASAQRLNWQRQRWEPVMHMSEARAYPAATLYNDEIYVAGGFTTAASAPLRSVERFNPHASAWKNLEPMETPRYATALAPFNGFIYACGGLPTPTYHCEKYHIKENYWSAAPNLVQHHDNHQMLVVNGKLVVLEGYDRYHSYTYLETFDTEKNAFQHLMDGETKGRQYQKENRKHSAAIVL